VILPSNVQACVAAGSRLHYEPHTAGVRGHQGLQCSYSLSQHTSCSFSCMVARVASLKSSWGLGVTAPRRWTTASPRAASNYLGEIQVSYPAQATRLGDTTTGSMYRLKAVCSER